MFEPFYTQMGLIIYRSPVACSMSDHGDVNSECETDSDLDDEEDVGVAETSRSKSL